MGNFLTSQGRVISIVGALLLAATFACRGEEPTKPASGGTAVPAASKAKPTLNVLAWVGYEEDEVRKPFEQEFGIRLKFDTFTGGDRMFSKLSQAPNLYDVVVVDPEYIAKLHATGLIRALDASEYDFSDYLTPFRKFPLCWIDGKLWAVLIRYGTNAIVYNTSSLTADDVQSYSVLWSPKVKDKVGLWDWYLPSMGVLSKEVEVKHNYGFIPPPVYYEWNADTPKGQYHCNTSRDYQMGAVINQSGGCQKISN